MRRLAARRAPPRPRRFGYHPEKEFLRQFPTIREQLRDAIPPARAYYAAGTDYGISDLRRLAQQPDATLVCRWLVARVSCSYTTWSNLVRVFRSTRMRRAFLTKMGHFPNARPWLCKVVWDLDIGSYTDSRPWLGVLRWAVLRLGCDAGWVARFYNAANRDKPFKRWYEFRTAAWHAARPRVAFCDEN